jgi:hypothetical protein
MTRPMPYIQICLRLALLAGLLGCVVAVHAQSAPTLQRVAGFGFPVSNERLDGVRGGFDLDGLQVSLGIERAVYIDGNLVTYASVNIPDLAHITTQQAMALANALSTVNVQNGPGNTFNPSGISSNTTAATVIQNTLNNQTIRNLTTLNVGVNTLNAFNNAGLQQAIQAVQAQALGH